MSQAICWWFNQYYDQAYKKVTGKRLTNTTFTVNIKEADEWDRSTNPLFEDKDYYFDTSYTEDDELISHMMKADGFPRNEAEELDPPKDKTISPHKLYINIPIQYELEEVTPLEQPLEGGCMAIAEAQSIVQDYK